MRHSSPQRVIAGDDAIAAAVRAAELEALKRNEPLTGENAIAAAVNAAELLTQSGTPKKVNGAGGAETTRACKTVPGQLAARTAAREAAEAKVALIAKRRAVAEAWLAELTKQRAVVEERVALSLADPSGAQLASRRRGGRRRGGWRRCGRRCCGQRGGGRRAIALLLLLAVSTELSRKNPPPLGLGRRALGIAGVARGRTGRRLRRSDRRRAGGGKRAGGGQGGRRGREEE